MAESLEKRVEFLENELGNYKKVLTALSQHVRSISDIIAYNKDKEITAYDIYMEGKRTNRTVHEPDDLIALVLHLHYKLGFSIREIVDSKLISRGKAYGIGTWDTAYAEAYVSVKGVADIYENGSQNADILKKYPKVYGLLGGKR